MFYDRYSLSMDYSNRMTGLIMRVRQQGFGEPNRIYILIPKQGTEKL